MYRRYIIAVFIKSTKVIVACILVSLNFSVTKL